MFENYNMEEPFTVVTNDEVNYKITVLFIYPTSSEVEQFSTYG